MTETTVRLHITPFTPDILPAVLPPSLRQTATDISFHTIPTFPENSYGYVTLPTMDAEKIKKKLNGSILKGKKFKVEAARPSKRERDAEDLDAGTEEKKESKVSKKRKSEKQEDGVIEGYELPSDRKVKRGWTEPSKKDRRRAEKSKTKGDKKEKPQAKSKYTEKEECLFRAKIPPNRKSLHAADEKKAKKNKKSTDNIVHEFAKATTYPSFLRTSGEDTAPTTEFDEEKGWVDAVGKVKEAASDKTRKPDYHPGQKAGAKVKKSEVQKMVVKQKSPEPSEESEDYTSSSGSSSDESSGSESEADSSSDDSSDSSDDEADKISEPEKQPAKTAPVTEDVAEESDSSSDSGSKSESDAEMAEESTNEAQEPSAQEVHPLEALFKRPASTSNTETAAPAPAAGFSFFGGDDIESDDEPQSAEPQTPFTPFTKKDLQIRGLRSAAPTPDTSMVNRRMNWTEADEEEDDEEEFSVDTPVSKSRVQEGPKEETEFAKWFWENRGENNRAWKKRRPPTSFCKCTCFSNSTIIPLDPSKSSSGAGTGLKLYERAFTTEELDDDLLQQQQRGKRQEFKIEVDAESESDSDSGNDASGTITERAQTYRALSCNDCNRKFCLDYELPICKDAKEEDIFTTCFQRDSRKDEAVVFIFIFATSGLLAWALLKPWIERYIERYFQSNYEEKKQIGFVKPILYFGSSFVAIAANVYDC
ncbi:hypothetical protein F1880_009475 [Penicillium rolfsii]|nr:hypothetical protein F1880_009475 [Penicillium rolfsii]